MDDKDRVQAYIALYKQQMERYGKTQDIEWKANIGIWTLLAGAIYLAAKETVSLSISLTGIILGLVIAVHCTWLYAVHTSEESDKVLWVQFRQRALQLIGSEERCGKASKRPWYKEAIWLLLEVGMTTILSLVLFAVLTTAK